MEFGEWIRLLRKERKLDIQSLAERSGVEASTISRAENARTQVTLLTAIRLCEGLEITSADILKTVYGEHSSKSVQAPLSVTPAVPKMSDVENFLSYYHGNEGEGKLWLADLLNRAVTMSRSTSQVQENGPLRLIVPEDIQKLLLESPVYRFEVQYPPAMSSDDIFTIYRCGGMLTLTDLGEYMKKLRRERQVTLEQMEQSVKLSPSILSRLETGYTEQIKLVDVLMLDRHLGQGGTLLSMYWEAYSCYMDIVRRQPAFAERNLKLATLFIVACRWLQLMNPQDACWIRNERSCEKLA